MILFNTTQGVVFDIFVRFDIWRKEIIVSIE